MSSFFLINIAFIIYRVAARLKVVGPLRHLNIEKTNGLLLLGCNNRAKNTTFYLYCCNYVLV